MRTVFHIIFYSFITYSTRLKFLNFDKNMSPFEILDHNLEPGNFVTHLTAYYVILKLHTIALYLSNYFLFSNAIITLHIHNYSSFSSAIHVLYLYLWALVLSFCHGSQTEEGQPVGTSHHLSDHQSMCRNASYAYPGLAEACRFVYNDAKFVNERARNDIILLSRYYLLSLWLAQK